MKWHLLRSANVELSVFSVSGEYVVNWARRRRYMSFALHFSLHFHQTYLFVSKNYLFFKMDETVSSRRMVRA